MKILVFTEGTVLLPKSALGLKREDVVELSRKEGIQREAAALQCETKNNVPVEPNSVYDFANYVPTEQTANKLKKWKEQGATICYLTSRRIKPEVEVIKAVLKKYNLPDSDNLLFRATGEEYKDVAERLMPDILIEDDCESIGGEKEMTYPHMKPESKDKIKSIVVKEFAGIHDLPDSIKELI